MGIYSVRMIWPVVLCWLYIISSRQNEAYSNHWTCSEEKSTCHFELTITHKLTMAQCGAPLRPDKGDLVYVGERPKPGCEEANVSADGYINNTRMVIVANGTMPGPTLDVYEDSTLVITVKNRLLSDSVTMHWHGVIQQDTNLMDGVAFVNQCPILPGLDFTYEFKVINAGSDFYHAHNGAQRTMGLFGPLVIRSRTKRPQKPRDDPPVNRDYTMMLNDWNHNFDSVVAHLKLGVPYEGVTEIERYKAPDGSNYPRFKWHSGLINGKGRYYNPVTKKHNNAPLSVFNVTRGETVRFRAIGAGTMFPLRVSIDNHDLIMISSDGYRFEDATVQSFIINPGERFDFKIKADKPSGCYWIRAETLEVGVNHSAEAILQYEENPLTNNNYDDYANNKCFKPWWNDKQMCGAGILKCKVLNCPFERYADSKDITCIHLQSLKTLEEDNTVNHNADFEERFFNFAFVDNHLSINGRHWENPPVSASAQSNELKDDYCTDPSCSTTGCTCTNYMNLERDKQYQFVFTSVGSGIGPAHPIHLHGHGFQVMYQGFAPLDRHTGHSQDDFTNADIDCNEGQPYPAGQSQTTNACNKPQWAAGRYSKIKPEFSVHPVKKDTIIIPTGGYAVIRFKANNPGFWYMHCHIELHNLGGMAMMFNEAPGSRDELLNNVPYSTSFPRCRNYPSELPKATTVASAVKMELGSKFLPFLLLAFLFGRM